LSSLEVRQQETPKPLGGEEVISQKDLQQEVMNLFQVVVVVVEVK
jgi:hypothetical protein